MKTDILEDIWDFMINALPWILIIIVLLSIILGVVWTVDQFNRPLWYIQPKGGGSFLYFHKDTYSCVGVPETDYILVTCKEIESGNMTIIQASVFQER